MLEFDTILGISLVRFWHYYLRFGSLFLISNEFTHYAVALASIRDASGSIFHQEICTFFNLKPGEILTLGGESTFPCANLSLIGNFF